MKQLINDQWSFCKLPAGSGLNDLSKATWAETGLPHDWLIGQKDLYESADAWYRRRICFTPDVSSSVMIHFDGVYMDCDVLLNGKVLATHPYGYTAFYVDLTNGLTAGENEILVHIRHQSPNSRWYSGSGVFRDVHLVTLPKDHLIPDSLYVTDFQQGGRRVVNISAETAGENGIPFSIRILDAEGNEVSSGFCLSADQQVTVRCMVENPILWSTERPYCYRLAWKYGDDEGESTIGFRDLRFDPERGFFLNGKQTKLKGVCLHHDLGCLGAAFHEKAARRQLELMMKMGANAIRTSHNPPAEKLLDLCDEMGILVVDEAFDMWERSKTPYDYARFFDEWEERDVAAWIRRDRTHPCVIMWSIGNEIYDMHADERGTEVTRMLTEQVRSHDPERHAEVTFGCNYMPWEGGQRCADVVKIPGYNYGEKYYDRHHREHPDWVIYGSETASVLSSRGIYHFPIDEFIMSESDRQCSALGNSNTSWGAQDLRKILIDDLKNEYSMGQFIWSGIDYIGEPTPYHTRSCYFGQADTACFPKDSWYLFQSLWTAEPMIHIGVTWDWNPGQRIDIPVMTNCAEAELFVNGRSVGRRNSNPVDIKTCRPVWTIPFEPGEIRAVGYAADGNVLAEDIRRTPGESRRLVITVSDSGLISDGHDLIFAEISTVDKNGYPVENARDRVRIRVSGGGILCGTDNGDSTDPDGYQDSVRRLFSGRLLAVIASNGLQEETVVEIESNTCGKASIKIPCIPAEKIPGTGCLHPACQDKELPEMVPVRRIHIKPESGLTIDREHPELVFHWTPMPENAEVGEIQWEVTNRLGIRTPYVHAVQTENRRVRVTAEGDGEFCLRALYGHAEDFPELISQMEIHVSGMGQPALNPYEMVSAGLYDLHEGEIGTGNEKGIAFARDGESMVGFSMVDFGTDGSDELVLPIFALNDDRYEIELFSGDPRKDGRLIDRLVYCRKSIWNVYQAETYHLPEVLRGVHTLCFRMHDKVHMKGFQFTPQKKTAQWLYAAEADEIYGDQFRTEGKAVRGIGNNVTLTFRGMDFGEGGDVCLTLDGETPLAANTISIRITDENGNTSDFVAEFRGGKREKQQFPLKVPEGVCSISFVFLPGSQFDFHGFTFSEDKTAGN